MKKASGGCRRRVGAALVAAATTCKCWSLKMAAAIASVAGFVSRKLLRLLHVRRLSLLLSFFHIRHRSRIRQHSPFITFSLRSSAPRSSFPNPFLSVSFTTCAIAILFLHLRRSLHYVRPLLPPRIVMVVCMALWSTSFVLSLPVAVDAHQYKPKLCTRHHMLTVAQ